MDNPNLKLANRINIYKHLNFNNTFTIDYFYEKYQFMDTIKTNNFDYIYKLKFLTNKLMYIKAYSEIDYNMCVLSILSELNKQSMMKINGNYSLAYILNNLFKEFLYNRFLLNKNIGLLKSTIEYIC